MLAVQGISKPMRKVLNMANMTLHISQYTGEDNNTHIDIQVSLFNMTILLSEVKGLDLGAQLEPAYFGSMNLLCIHMSYPAFCVY
jgi:hypothetical protein